MNFSEQELIGKKVQLISTHAIGTIVSVSCGYMQISFWGELVKYKFPEAFGTVLVFEDPDLQEQLEKEGSEQSFEVLKKRFIASVNSEIEYLKATGGKKYKAIDGILVSIHDHECVYAFDVDTDLHFPDGTAISILRETGYLRAFVVACEEFTLMIRTTENIGGEIPVIEFTANQWELLVLLNERIEELSALGAPLAYEVASKGPSKVKEYAGISTGQKVAINKAENNPVTFIWGPPGTGKTETLSNIALDLIGNGKRVLMLFYSNVSVDGALLRVSKKSDYPAGTVVRYGFPRMASSICKT